MRLVAWVCAVAVLHVLAPAPAAGSDGAGAPLDERRPAERLRERLSALPAEERVRLEHHLEEFERLPAAARARLLERARALREREQAMRTAAPEAGPRCTGLDEERPGERWRARLRECFRERGREVRARLPAELRRRLEQAPPDVRRAVLERIARGREQKSLDALRWLRQRAELEPKELERLERLSPPERLRALRELCPGEPGHRARRGPWRRER
jgi:hypothetical protein